MTTTAQPMNILHPHNDGFSQCYIYRDTHFLIRVLMYSLPSPLTLDELGQYLGNRHLVVPSPSPHVRPRKPRARSHHSKILSSPSTAIITRRRRRSGARPRPLATRREPRREPTSTPDTSRVRSFPIIRPLLRLLSKARICIRSPIGIL